MNLNIWTTLFWSAIGQTINITFPQNMNTISYAWIDKRKVQYQIGFIINA